MKKQSRFKLFLATIVALLFNAMIGVAATQAMTIVGINISPLAGVAVANAIGIAIGEYRIHFAPDAKYSVGLFFNGLSREVYLSLLMKKYRPNTGWLQKCRDLSAYVENDIINLADAGADPGVIINYDSTYDIPVAADEDSPVALQLKTLSTEQSKIAWNAQRTRAYSIAGDRAERHANTLMQMQGALAAYGIAPDQTGNLKFVRSTTGDADAQGFYIPTLDDFIDMMTDFKTANISLDNGIVGVIHPTHLAYWQKEEKVLFKDLVSAKPGEMAMVMGTECFVSTQTPLYNGATGQRKAFGAGATPSTDTISSFFFVEGEAGYAKGSVQAFVKSEDPSRQASFVNFAMAFFGGSIRNKGIGALYSGKA